MSYRDDLEAAHARIEALEAELARLKDENARLVDKLGQLDADAELRRIREARKLGPRVKPEDVFDEERLREQMKREEAEVEAKIRAMRDEIRSPFRGDD